MVCHSVSTVFLLLTLHRFWPRKCDPDKLFKTELSPLHSHITLEQESSSSRHYLQCHEVSVNYNVECVQF